MKVLEFKNDPFDIQKDLYRGDFKQAREYLHRRTTQLHLDNIPAVGTPVWISGHAAGTQDDHIVVESMSERNHIIRAGNFSKSAFDPSENFYKELARCTLTFYGRIIQNDGALDRPHDEKMLDLAVVEMKRADAHYFFIGNCYSKRYNEVDEDRDFYRMREAFAWLKEQRVKDAQRKTRQQMRRNPLHKMLLSIITS
jgi:hypothetical protein